MNFFSWVFDIETLVSLEELETDEYLGLLNNSTFFVSTIYLFLPTGLELWTLSELLLPLWYVFVDFSVLVVIEL